MSLSKRHSDVTLRSAERQRSLTEMKRKRISIAVAVGVVLIAALAERWMWNHTYPYMFWRVGHPFGPNVEAFGKIVATTQRETYRIPYLIERIDGPDGWWIQSAFKAWFPDGPHAEHNKRQAWKQWWEDHRLAYQSFIIPEHDPQF